MPNYDYGFNKGFPYTPYPSTSHHFNHIMQYPMTGNPFSFGGPFAPPFTNNGTPSMPTPSNNFKGSGDNSNGGNNNSGDYNNGGNNNNNHHNTNNGGGTSNGPNSFQFADIFLQHLKYEGYGDPSEHLALFLNNIV
eukprot:Gb_39326 [translate_table: standard]